MSGLARKILHAVGRMFVLASEDMDAGSQHGGGGSQSSSQSVSDDTGPGTSDDESSVFDDPPNAAPRQFVTEQDQTDLFHGELTSTMHPRKRQRLHWQLPSTSYTQGPFPGDGDAFKIGPNGETLTMPSYLAMSGYAVIPNQYQPQSAAAAVVVPSEESSPSATSWAAAIASPNATKSSASLHVPEKKPTSKSPLSINWFCRLSINKHFSVKKGFGGRVPPIHWRGSDAQMIVWRRMTRQEQDEEWSRWSALPYEVRKEKTESLEMIQAGNASAGTATDDSPNRDPPENKIVLSLSAACQTDEQLLDFRDVADEVIIERLSKRVKTTDEQVKVAPPREKSHQQPPVAEVTVERTDSFTATGEIHSTSKAAPDPAQHPAKAPAAAARPANHHAYGLAPRYSSYHDQQRPFSFSHHVPPKPASAGWPPRTANRTSNPSADTATTGDRKISDEEYDRIQRNESARHLIKALS